MDKIDNWVNSMEKEGIQVTSPEICKIMASIGKLFNPSSILDPNGGIGEILYYCNFGQTLDAYTVNRDYINLSKSFDNRINFIYGDFLGERIDKKYDLVITEVPFSYGINPQNGKETFKDLEYLDKIFGLLNDGGVLVTLLPGRFLYEEYSKPMRQKILDEFSLEMILELPYPKYKLHNHDANIVVIKNDKQRDKVFIREYHGDIENVIREYLNQDGEYFIDKKLLSQRWDRHYHSKEFNWLNVYTPSHSKPIGDMAEVFHGLWGVKHEEVGEIILLSIMNDSDNIQYGRIVATPKDLYVSREEIADKSKYLLQNGDLLVRMKMDSYINIIYYDDTMPKAMASTGYIIIRPREEYFKEFTSTIEGRRFIEDYFKRLVKHTGRVISLEDIKKVEIPLFDPKDIRLIERYKTNTVEEEELILRLNEIQIQLRNARIEREKKEREIQDLQGQNNQVQDDLLQECLVRIRNLEGMEGLVKLLIHEFKNLNKTVHEIKETGEEAYKDLKEVKKTGEETYRMVKDIYSLMKDLHRIQDEIINKLNEAMDKDEKEAIYNELSENVLELINRRYGDRKKEGIKEIKEEYVKMFTPEGWEKLEEETRRFLITARVVYFDLKEHEDIIDFSPTCIALTKALEREMHSKVFIRMQEYFKGKGYNLAHLPDGIIDRYYDKKKGQYRYGYKSKNKFTLGSVPYVLAVRFGQTNMDKDMNKKKDMVKEFFRDYLFKGYDSQNDYELDAYIKTLSDDIQDITNKYRNRAAHKDAVTITQAEECYSLLIATEKILIKFISKLR